MLICRTCLSKSDLKPIFQDINLAHFHSEQLFLACGVKIQVNDGLAQSICTACLNLVNAALKLREQSIKSEEILKKTYKAIKIEPEQNNIETLEKQTDKKNNIKEKCKKKESQNSEMEHKKNKIDLDIFTNRKKSKKEWENSKIEHRKTKCNVKKRFYKKKSNQCVNKTPYTVCIEDFESSNDSDFMNDFLINDLSSDDDKKVSIEDFESSDSCEEKFKNIIKKEAIENNKLNWKNKEKEFLERERRKLMFKEQDQKLLSLAVTPYSNGGPIRCTLCNKELRNLQNFRCHAKTHFEPQYACEECGKKFINPSHVRYHLQRVHGRSKRLSCAQCCYRAVDPLQLQNHMRAEHTGERPYICDVCGDSFRMRANIAQHMRKHFGVRNLQCERCPAMFRSRSELTGHQNRVHYLIYTYFCYLCPETYKRPASVRKHLINVHGVPKNQQLPIKCIKTRKGEL